MLGIVRLDINGMELGVRFGWTFINSFTSLAHKIGGRCMVSYCGILQILEPNELPNYSKALELCNR